MSTSLEGFFRAPFPELDLVGPLLGRPHPQERPTIYVDGGSRWRPVSAVAAAAPAIAIGDGDSGSGALDVRLPAEKNFSDLAFALSAVPAFVSRLRLFGFVGGRADHDFANRLEILRFLGARESFTRADLGESAVAFARGSVELTREGLFSVFSLDEGHVRIAGACRYPLDGPLKASSSHGLSNEASGIVSIAARHPVMVMFS